MTYMLHYIQLTDVIQATVSGPATTELTGRSCLEINFEKMKA